MRTRLSDLENLKKRPDSISYYRLFGGELVDLRISEVGKKQSRAPHLFTSKNVRAGRWILRSLWNILELYMDLTMVNRPQFSGGGHALRRLHLLVLVMTW